MEVMDTQETYLGSPDNPKTAGVVCYITFIGWLIAYFALYRNNKNRFAAFHIRQTLLLHILSFFLNILSLFALWGWIPYFILIALSVLLFILWLIGAFDAINGKERPVPLVGRAAQRLFANL
jgi:uncharacterized membrane protein